ncbi:hypothetical protein LCGC14_1209740 [marine sediment metagenome]|uniref:Uncharacterized protein n=1 Tax=marine sediment metagenome TaxID=412755 RepID=A0A0F9LEC3_9ZZZZ
MTPAKGWRVTHNKECNCWEVRSGITVVASDIEWEEDAIQLAAAPKLLEVCKAILPVAQNIEEYLFDKTDDIGNPSLFNQLACLEIEAYSAIAKAERDKP